MNQSDSPDFEFDPSNLEVEGFDAPASEEGPALAGRGVSPQSKRKQESDNQDLEDATVSSGEGSESSSAFEIDELPDSSPLPAAGQQRERAGLIERHPASEDAQGANAEPKADAVERPARLSRELGADDLGAEVFAEIESPPEASGLGDVIEDLMEEVESFEAGSLVEIEEGHSSEATLQGDALYELEDPDDALIHSVDSKGAESQEPAREQIPPEEIQSRVDSGMDQDNSATGETASDPLPNPDGREVPAPVAEGRDIESSFEKRVEEAYEVSQAMEPSVEETQAAAAASPAVEESTRQAGPEKNELPAPALESESQLGAPEEVSDGSGVTESADESAEEPEELIEEESLVPGQSSPVAALDRAEEPAMHDDSEQDRKANGAESAEDGTLGAKYEDSEDAKETLSDQGEASLGASYDEASGAASERLEAEPETSSASSASEESSESLPLVPPLVEVDDQEDDFEAFEDSQSLAPAEEKPGEEGEQSAEALEEKASEDPVAGLEEELPLPPVAEGEDDDLSELIEALSEDSQEAAAERTAEEEGAAGLAVLEESEEAEDLDEEKAPLAPQVPGLSEGEQEESESLEIVDASLEEEPAETAEEMLEEAADLPADEGKKPIEQASDLLEELDPDSEDEELVSEAAANQPEALDEQGEQVAMPEASELIAEVDPGESDPQADAVEADAAAEDRDQRSGNVADRAGDLPEAPPPPVEIIDEEPPDEDYDSVGEEEAAEPPALGDNAHGGASLVEEGATGDPYGDDVSLDEFSDDLGDLGEVIGEDAEQDIVANANEGGENSEDVPAAQADEVLEMPKPGLLWRLAHSLSLAAGFALVGLASVLAIWKQQIVEFIEGRDLDASSLIAQVRDIGTDAMGGFDEEGSFSMQWIDSEVRRVSEGEIRIQALVGAQLREDLFSPISESELAVELDEQADQLEEALLVARERFPAEIGNYPEKPWRTLVRKTAEREVITPLRMTYALTRASNQAEWELSRVKVSGYREELVWPEGESLHSFGERAYDVDSARFDAALSKYKRDSIAYVASIDMLIEEEQRESKLLARENRVQRERIEMALAKGTHFEGVAILGEGAEASRDIRLIITEMKPGGTFVKGVVKLGSQQEEASKHFVGELDFEQTQSGREQAYLNLNTVYFDLPPHDGIETRFFDPRSVSSMRLKADGFRLEGDSRDLSMRLTRSM